jgi:hypothetical protein
MPIDPIRLAEAAVGAAVALGSSLLPAAWHALDLSMSAVLTAVWIVLTSGVYALHAVTFDTFRLTGQHRRRIFSFTRSEE